jgi:hypothetical protein
VTSDALSNYVSTQEEPGTTTVSHTVTQQEPTATTSQPSSNVTVVPIPTTTLPITSGTVPIATKAAISVAAPFNPTLLISVFDDVGLHVPQSIKEARSVSFENFYLVMFYGNQIINMNGKNTNQQIHPVKR